MLSNISGWQLGICLLIVILIFGTGWIRTVSGDIVAGLKDLRDNVRDEDDST